MCPVEEMKTAKETLSGNDLETTSTVIQGTILFLRVTVIIMELDNGKISYGEQKTVLFSSVDVLLV